MKLGEMETAIMEWLEAHMFGAKMDLCLADAAFYGKLTMRQMALVMRQTQEQCVKTAVALREMGLAGRAVADSTRNLEAKP